MMPASQRNEDRNGHRNDDDHNDERNEDRNGDRAADDDVVCILLPQIATRCIALHFRFGSVVVAIDRATRATNSNACALFVSPSLTISFSLCLTL